MKNREKKVFLLFFGVILVAGFLYSVIYCCGFVYDKYKEYLEYKQGEKEGFDVVDGFEDGYNEIFSDLNCCLDVFSITQRLLCKHEVRNFEVIKSNDGTLYLQNEIWPSSEEDLNNIAEDYETIYSETIKYGGKLLFVQVPYKNADQSPELEGYSFDQTEISEDKLIELITKRGIPVLDLREYEDCKEYYKTDNHWTAKSSLFAANIIADKLENGLDLDMSGHDYYGDINNYDDVTYSDCFLGSYGIKVGQYYTGKDDFEVLKPKFSTDYRYEHYQDGIINIEHEGDFWEAFIDSEILETSYINKYNAFLYGGNEEFVINNKMSKNDYKGLLITHSYGRPLAPYLSMNFRELRFVDLNNDRFDDNCIDYIREHQPDVVILMYNGFINIGDL